MCYLESEVINCETMKRYRIIVILAAVALVNATYLSYKAYFFRYVDPLGLTSFCDFSKVNSCSEVLRHPLANVFGIPFPWIALAVYPILLGLAWYGYKHRSYAQAKVIVVLSFLGVCFNGLIIYREIFFIKAYCLLCLMCTALIISIFIISRRMVKESKLSSPASESTP